MSEPTEQVQLTGLNRRAPADLDNFLYGIISRVPDARWFRFCREGLKLTEDQILGYRRQAIPQEEKYQQLQTCYKKDRRAFMAKFRNLFTRPPNNTQLDGTDSQLPYDLPPADCYRIIDWVKMEGRDWFRFARTELGKEITDNTDIYGDCALSEDQKYNLLKSWCQGEAQGLPNPAAQLEQIAAQYPEGRCSKVKIGTYINRAETVNMQQ